MRSSRCSSRCAPGKHKRGGAPWRRCDGAPVDAVTVQRCPGQGGALMPSDPASPLGVVAGGILAFAQARVSDDKQLVEAITTLQEVVSSRCCYEPYEAAPSRSAAAPPAPPRPARHTCW
jgi:hypothetical protein